MTMKKRQYLPLMAKLDLKVDIERLTKEFFEFGYDNWDMYDGLKKDGCASEEGLVVRRVLLEYFLNDEELAERDGAKVAEGGEAYKMLCITGYNEDKPETKMGTNDIVGLVEQYEPHELARKLEKVSDPSHPMYVPIADEKNYDKRNDYCKGYVAEVMDMLEEKIGHVARSRYAVLMPGEEIKPHMDINTDKAIRIHIPLLTNEECVVGVEGKKRRVEEHLQADGSVYFLNQGYTHWVKNDGDTPRVHLVFVVIGQDGIDDALLTWDDVVVEEAVA